MEEATDRIPHNMPEDEDTTVGTLCESIETNMWLADAYFARGARGLAVECLREAWMEYVRFQDILRVYAGDRLGQQLVEALVAKAGENMASLALGATSPSASAAGPLMKA